jgi:putative endonuclease
MTFHVYILRCADDSYYTGHTDDLETRLNQHAAGADKHCYTACRLPVTPIFTQEFATREEALAMELKIKGGSRAKKEALMADDWGRVVRLARNRAKGGG